MSRCRTSIRCCRSSMSTENHSRFRYRRLRPHCMASATVDYRRHRRLRLGRRQATLPSSPRQKSRRGTDYSRSPSARGASNQVSTSLTVRYNRLSVILCHLPFRKPSRHRLFNRLMDIELWTPAESLAVCFCRIRRTDYLRLWEMISLCQLPATSATPVSHVSFAF